MMNLTTPLIALSLLGCLLACFALPAARPKAPKPRPVDYALSAHVDDWLRHPVYGDPSFDSFERLPGNPIYRGSGDFTWPVNGFLFIDPKSANWYIYVGDYRSGYGGGQARCLLLRSTDRAKTWQNLGPVIQGDPAMFDKGGYAPDATVVYDRGRYHMVYDWNVPEVWGEGGLAYAWADTPEGPWHRAPEPITRNTTLSKLNGRYSRTYGATLIRRKGDWLVLGLMDHAPNSWTMFAMTAKRPEGPYSERRIVRQVETPAFHPPLMEFFPAFVHNGWVYAPATSVALNRDFVSIFRAPLERAHRPSAWSIYRHGSAWHSEPFENEDAGLWGQTFSGQVLADGRLLAMFNSRDPKNLGTVNIASRPWAKPLRTRGFVLSGHAGPSFTCLNRSYKAFTLTARFKVKGTAAIVFDYRGVMGPDKPTSDATLHALTMASYNGIRITDDHCQPIAVDAAGNTTNLFVGMPFQKGATITVRRNEKGLTTLSLDGFQDWHCATTLTEGPIGLWVGPNGRLEVERFEIEGESTPAHLNYLYTEGLLGAGESETDWETQHGPEYRFGVGAVHKGLGGVAKWNFYGTGVRFWSPTGPQFGKASVSIDGGKPEIVNLRSDLVRGPVMIWEEKGLRYGPHALVVRSAEGTMPIDGVEVIAAAR